jgi:hypothetical protein
VADSFVTVHSCYSVEEAYVLKNLLEAEGIAVFLADEKTTGFAWHLSNAIGGVKLQVAADQAERAATILESPPDRLTAAELDSLAVEPGPLDCAEEMQDFTGTQGGAADEEENVEVEDNAELPGDGIVQRAWRAAVLGIVICPPTLHLYSLFLLGQLTFSNKEVSPSANAKQVGAFVIDFLAVLFGYVLISNIIR